MTPLFSKYRSLPPINRARVMPPRKSDVGKGRYASATDRFFSRIKFNPETGCWLWTRCTGHGGYAVLVIGRANGKKLSQLAHRFAYQLLRGPIPDGLVLDHLCSNPICLNPTRVEPVTQHVNVIRAYRERRVVCQNGHPLSEVYVHKKIPPHGRTCGLECRECRRAAKRRHWAQHKDRLNAARRVARSV